MPPAGVFPAKTKRGVDLGLCAVYQAFAAEK